jgi:serine-type D-Ala-D-Ala carboxypeptidase (penicillin-binding protein 5/6)
MPQVPVHPFSSSLLPWAAGRREPIASAARGGGAQYILIDLTSQQVLAEREADAQADPASLTKLMTAYLTFNACATASWRHAEAPVSQRAWSERRGGGSLMFIDPKMTPTVDELLRGMIVQSGNDASVALAEAVGGHAGAVRRAMNQQARPGA